MEWRVRMESEVGLLIHFLFRVLYNVHIAQFAVGYKLKLAH
jgi:hypothetical protein